MPIQPVAPPLKYAGDLPGPFAGGRPLKVLIDLPAGSRQPDERYWNMVIVPDIERMLWSLCQHETIEVFWIAHDDEEGVGAVHLQEPDLGSDHVPYVATHGDGSQWMHAISFYRQARQHAATNPNVSLDTILKAALASDLRVDLMATTDPELLALDGSYGKNANAMTPTDALALIGLHLRTGDSAPVVGPKLHSFGIHMLAWSAVRAQVPNGWAWGSALVDHGQSIGDDYYVLLFGSFHERLVRMLTHRDNIHRAMLKPADNSTGLAATEALDTLMFNVVGAFDAAAVAAHAGAGLPEAERNRAGWQRKNWRMSLGVPHLDQMFHKNTPADDLFAVCRKLRNTVHGAGLHPMVSSSMKGKENLVQLPRADAEEVRERLSRLGDQTSWGIKTVDPIGSYVDPAKLVEGLTPRIFATLDEILVHTPLTHLTSTGPHKDGPPDKTPFDLGSRVRTSLLYGLTPPCV